jgi:hypothetical protein
MQRLERIVHGLIIALCEWILKQIDPKPEPKLADFGKHNILVRRDDGSVTPMDDDELWDMMDEIDEKERSLENWWLVTFAKAARQFGEGVYANH